MREIDGEVSDDTPAESQQVEVTAVAEAIASRLGISGLGIHSLRHQPVPHLPACLAGHTLNACLQFSESVVFVSTFTRTKVPSRLTFTFAAQTVSASSGWIPSPWRGIAAFRRIF